MAVCKKCGGPIEPDGMRCSQCGEPTLAGKFDQAGRSMEKTGASMQSAGCSIMSFVVSLVILVPIVIIIVAVGC